MRATLDLPRDPELLAAALEGLVAVAELQLLRGEVPPLYDSGVRYEVDDPGHVQWRTATQAHRRRRGDCKELVPWRVAELRLRGRRARCKVLPTSRDLWHVVVALDDDDELEDPSAILGMYTPQIVRRIAMDTDADATTATDPQVIASLMGDEERIAGDELLEAAGMNNTAAMGADDLIAADADSVAREAAPVPVKPSVRWLTTKRSDGTHEANISIRLADGRELRPVVHASSRPAALRRAAQLANKLISDPAVQMLIPPQAVTAVRAINALATRAMNGTLHSEIGRFASNAMNSLARALS